MDCWISRTISAPIDISTLVDTAFIDCEVLAFHLKTAGLHDLVDIKPKALSADEIIWTLKTKFRYLKDQELWSPSEENKLDTEGDLADLNLAMNNLVESQKRGQTGGNV